MTYKGDHNMIEKRVAALVAQGVDCTQWAQSHGIAMSNTATKSDSPAAIGYRAQLIEATAQAQAMEHTRHYLSGLKLLHGSNEYNNGKTDAQRLSEAQKMVTKGGTGTMMSHRAVGTGLVAGNAVTVYGNYVYGNNASPNYWYYDTTGSLQSWHAQQGLQTSHSQEQPVVITGKQYVVVCNGRVEYEDDKGKAQATAERLAHANQQDAFILKPVSRTAPKRDVVTTEIKL